MDRDAAEALVGPFFGASLFPYLGFLYLLDVPENGTPMGVTVGFATCLLFVFLTIRGRCRQGLVRSEPGRQRQAPRER